MKRITRWLAIAFIVISSSICTRALAVSPAVNSKSEKVYWKGESDGFITTWTNKDLRVERGGKLIYSAQEEMSASVKEFMGSHGVTCNQYVRLLSLVGPYLSFKYS